MVRMVAGGSVSVSEIIVRSPFRAPCDNAVYGSWTDLSPAPLPLDPLPPSTYQPKELSSVHFQIFYEK